MLQEFRRRLSAAISSWDRPLLTESSTRVLIVPHLAIRFQLEKTGGELGVFSSSVHTFFRLGSRDTKRNDKMLGSPYFETYQFLIVPPSTGQHLFQATKNNPRAPLNQEWMPFLKTWPIFPFGFPSTQHRKPYQTKQVHIRLVCRRASTKQGACFLRDQTINNTFVYSCVAGLMNLQNPSSIRRSCTRGGWLASTLTAPRSVWILGDPKMVMGFLLASL